MLRDPDLIDYPSPVDSYVSEETPGSSFPRVLPRKTTLGDKREPGALDLGDVRWVCRKERVGVTDEVGVDEERGEGVRQKDRRT